MKLQIDLDVFSRKFLKKSKESSTDQNTKFSIIHKPPELFHLFPFNTHDNDAVISLEATKGAFIRLIQNESPGKFDFESFIEKICQQVVFSYTTSEQEKDIFVSFLKELYLNSDGSFNATKLGTYKFILCSNKEEKIARYLFDVLCSKDVSNKKYQNAIQNGNYNVLDELIILSSDNSKIDTQEKKYFSVKANMQNIFQEDLEFLLNDTKFAEEYLSDLLELYYFFYTSQTCLELNKFFEGSRHSITPLYFSLDWEKTSKSRLCYTNGWQLLQPKLDFLFSHAVTLEILNQNDELCKLDYIAINQIIAENSTLDDEYATQVRNVAKLYRDHIHDCIELNDVKYHNYALKTEQEIKYLFDSIFTQFENTGRKKANKSYAKNFEYFCKQNVLKNRKSMGLMLNLTDKNILFLTKLCLKQEKRMRLAEMFNEFERRGIFLDNTSKMTLLSFYEKLNLIEKKSDSGDAQYVKGIL